MSDVIQAGISGIIQAPVLAIAAVGFTLQFSVTNYFNFGYGEWLTTGAFLAWALNQVLHINIWGSLLLAGVAIGILSVVLNRVVFLPFSKRRSNPMFILIVTFAVGYILNEILILIWGTTFRVYGQLTPHNYKVASITISNQQIVFLIITIGVMLATQLLLHKTKLGRSMRAVADNRDLADVNGLRTSRIIDQTWALTGLMAGIAGVILAMTNTSFNNGLGESYTYLVFPAVIIGGIGNIYGAVIGAFIVSFFAGIGPAIISSGISPVIIFVALVAFILLRPQGILGGREAATS